MEPPQSFSYSELKEMVHEIQVKLSSTDRPVWKMRGDPNTLIPAVDRAGVMQAGNFGTVNRNGPMGRFLSQ
jgi:hypothetical protein